MEFVAPPMWFWLTVLFVFGLVFGSFGNVVIWRLPRRESLSHPASHCPVCDSPIAPRDNVPLLSWILLRGRCRTCGSPISIRYPAVELLSGLLWLVAGVRFGVSWASLACAVFFYLLMLLTFIDWDTMRLPNVLVGWLFSVGAGGAAVSQLTQQSITPLLAWSGGGWLGEPLVGALAGAVVGAGIVLLISLVYAAIRRTQGMGMGDVKLLAAMGVFLGVYTPMALFFGTLFGAAYGLFSAWRSHEGGKHKFAFGPFLALGGVTVALFGPAIWTWYVGLARMGM